MKKMVLAAFAVMSLGVGAAHAQSYSHSAPANSNNGWNTMATSGN
jgi:hypothetical protein